MSNFMLMRIAFCRGVRKTRARFFPQPPAPETNPFSTEIVTFLLHLSLHLKTDNFCPQDRCRRIQLYFPQGFITESWE